MVTGGSSVTFQVVTKTARICEAGIVKLVVITERCNTGLQLSVSNTLRGLHVSHLHSPEDRVA